MPWTDAALPLFAAMHAAQRLSTGKDATDWLLAYWMGRNFRAAP